MIKFDRKISGAVLRILLSGLEGKIIKRNPMSQGFAFILPMKKSRLIDTDGKEIKRKIEKEGCCLWM